MPTERLIKHHWVTHNSVLVNPNFKQCRKAPNEARLSILTSWQSLQKGYWSTTCVNNEVTQLTHAWPLFQYPSSITLSVILLYFSTYRVSAALMLANGLDIVPPLMLPLMSFASFGYSQSRSCVARHLSSINRAQILSQWQRLAI